MPAKSKRQQQAMAMELERREEGKKPRRFKSMSARQLRDFAQTDTKGLPERVRNKNKS